MKKLTPKELYNMWIEFFTSHGHVQIPSASVIPENDATVLFTTAGMQPLVPYLLGEKHPKGTRLCNVQKCIRTNDIESVGDSSHLTMFEMLGNWSLGDYFKKEMIPWSFEFLTSEKYLNIPIDRLAVTVFEGDSLSPRDEEGATAWLNAGIKKENIFYLSKEHNWWALGSGVGPCGTDSEMFYDTGKPKCCETCSPACDCGKYLEIWNDVFMQFRVEEVGGECKELSQKNVDTGMGLERVVCISNNLDSVYDSIIFADAIKKIEELSGKSYSDEENKKPIRIICDHIRTATNILGDEKGIAPSNVGQGYVLRRLIRRAVNYARRLGIKAEDLIQVSNTFIDYFVAYNPDVYSSLDNNRKFIIDELAKEINKFSQTIVAGTKEFEKQMANLKDNTIDGVSAFRLYDTFGFPLELTIELASDRGAKVDVEGYNKAFEHHQAISRQGAEASFKGGLSEANEVTAKLHTATHLLLGALRKTFGEHIYQKGSNITPERLRFDFNFERKLLPEELKTLEDIVNQAINDEVEITCEEMPIEKARESGALGVFGDKYGEVVKVYTMGDYSKEICGGPHAKNTKELHHFKIVKEESSSSGVRRIKAILD
ncbi:MAG: alanine--tRNA ligase [Clostridia bacterium]|nr:alanine--tRNA ligase [Clostridia bacterium]